MENQNLEKTVDDNSTQKETTIISFATQKGGSGKTTLTHMISVALGEDGKGVGKNVLVIDMDFQRSLSTVYKRLKRKTEGFLSYDLLSATLEDGDDVVEKLIRDNYGKYDYILLDPPGTLMANGLKEIFLFCDYIFIPIEPSQLAIDAASISIKLFSEIKELRKAKGYGFEFYTFVSLAEPGTLWSRQVQEYLEGINIPTMEVYFPKYNAYKNLTQTGDNIISKDKKWGKEAFAFDRFYTEFISIIKL